MEVARGIERALAPVEAELAAPDWLRPDQIAPFRRVVAALDGYGAALLADPVGSGKTYIAMAVARQLHGGRPVAVLVPAAIAAQWRETASRLGVALEVQSHESLSRGRLPDPRTVLVIVDESHRFRHPGIRRYRALARWGIGRPLLLLSATPVVNRLEDLGHQLLLGLRSDALALDGVPDLLEQLERRGSHPAFGRVVLCRPAPADRPCARRAERGWRPPEEFNQLLRQIDRLKLSTHPGVASLIRLTLLRSLASSLAALSGALRRYLALLDHSRSAAGTGRRVTRAHIRQFSSAGLEQLVMWELLPDSEGPADLVPDDRAPILEMIDQIDALKDPRIADLAGLLADGAPTIVFTASRDTLRALRHALGSSVAWLSGDGAGIGAVRLGATSVLDCFRPGDVSVHRINARPHILVATDVAAEGLDLQRAERIVHFDLPWTPMRLDQREGRAVRLGNVAAKVDVITYWRWPELEGRIMQAERLLRKRATIDSAGVSEESHWLFRWRGAFISGRRDPPRWTAIVGECAGWLAAVAIDRIAPTGEIVPTPAELVWIPDDGEIVTAPEVTTALLQQASTAPLVDQGFVPMGPALARLAEWIRLRLRASDASRWRASDIDGAQRRLMHRLQLVGRVAAQQRDRRLVDRTQQAIAWLGGGLTAGERLLVEELIGLTPGELAKSLTRMVLPARLRVTGVPHLCGAVRVIFPP